LKQEQLINISWGGCDKEMIFIPFFSLGVKDWQGYKYFCKEIIVCAKAICSKNLNGYISLISKDNRKFCSQSGYFAFAGLA